MKLIKLVSELALLLGNGVANAGVIVHDLRVKEQVGSFNPQPDPPGKSIILQ